MDQSLLSVLGALVLLAVCCKIEAEAIEPMNPDFERLKQRLIGTWSFEEEGNSYDATFEAVSHGQALLERNSGFIAVYHPDGNSVVMTLYTRDGSQPRLRAHGFDEKSGSIAFVFQDITNWTKGTEHISGLEIVFRTPDHIVERWKTQKPGGIETAFEFELHRKGV